MKPWVRNDGIFEFLDKRTAYEAIQMSEDRVLRMYLLFCVHERGELRVWLPEKLASVLERYEEALERKITPPVIKQEITTEVIPENFLVPGFQLFSDLSVNFDFGFLDGDRAKWKSANFSDLGVAFKFSDILEALPEGTQVLLCTRDDMVGILCAYYRSVFPNASYSQVSTLLKIACKYIAYGLPSYSGLLHRQSTIKLYWESRPSDADLQASWEESEPSELSNKSKLPFDRLYSDYLVNGDRSPYFGELLDMTKDFFYAWHSYFSLTCVRVLLSCTFSTPFNEAMAFPTFTIDRLLGRSVSGSLWNFYRSDESLSFLFDSDLSLDFDESNHKKTYLKLMDSEVIKRMWETRLGERLPIGSYVGEEDPRQIMRRVFDEGVRIHNEQDWKSFLDSSDFGMNWCIKYNIARRFRHFYQRMMVEYFNQQGGLPL